MQVPYLHPTEAYYLEQDVIMNCWSCINTTPAKDGPLAYVPTEGVEGLRFNAEQLYHVKIIADWLPHRPQHGQWHTGVILSKPHLIEIFYLPKEKE
jgi:hypothetical protein